MAEIDKTIGFWTLGDFRPQMPLVSGRTALLHRLCVRLQTPRGRFSGVGPDGKTWGWPNFGTDLAAYLLTKVPASTVAAAVESECLKDEQVEDIRAAVEFSADRRTMRVAIEVFDSKGPFRFTLGIDQAKLELIELQAS